MDSIDDSPSIRFSAPGTDEAAPPSGALPSCNKTTGSDFFSLFQIKKKKIFSADAREIQYL